MIRTELLKKIYELLGTDKGLSGLEKCPKWCLKNLKEVLEEKNAKEKK